MHDPWLSFCIPWKGLRKQQQGHACPLLVLSVPTPVVCKVRVLESPFWFLLNSSGRGVGGLVGAPYVPSSITLVARYGARWILVGVSPPFSPALMYAVVVFRKMCEDISYEDFSC